MNTEYLSSVATAKLIRAALKRSFPGVKFSVRSSSYAGGASIDVSWTDGPTTRMVDAVTSQYRGGDFDGSIDMKISRSCWLRPDGTATVATDPGSTGSGGCIRPQREWMPEPGCRLVRFGSDFVFAKREMSPAFAERVLAAAQRRYGTLEIAVSVSPYDGTAALVGSYDDERKVREVAARFMIVTAGV